MFEERSAAPSYLVGIYLRMGKDKINVAYLDMSKLGPTDIHADPLFCVTATIVILCKLK